MTYKPYWHVRLVLCRCTTFWGREWLRIGWTILSTAIFIVLQWTMTVTLYHCSSCNTLTCNSFFLSLFETLFLSATKPFHMQLFFFHKQCNHNMQCFSLYNSLSCDTVFSSFLSFFFYITCTCIPNNSHCISRISALHAALFIIIRRVDLSLVFMAIFYQSEWNPASST